jgi:hypothetical protein
MQKAKDRLEEQNASLEEHLYYVEKLMEDKDDALSRERELNNILLDKLQGGGQDIIQHNNETQYLNERIGSLLDTISCLSNTIEALKMRIENNAAEMEGIYKKVRKMVTNQRRLTAHERSLEEHLKQMLDLVARLQMRDKARGRDGRDSDSTCYKCSNYLDELSLGKIILPNSSAEPDDASISERIKSKVWIDCLESTRADFEEALDSCKRNDSISGISESDGSMTSSEQGLTGEGLDVALVSSSGAENFQGTLASNAKKSNTETTKTSLLNNMMNSAVLEKAKQRIVQLLQGLRYRSYNINFKIFFTLMISSFVTVYTFFSLFMQCPNPRVKTFFILPSELKKIFPKN